MDITWAQISSGAIQTPYSSQISKYTLHQTKILESTIPINVLQSPETRTLLIEKDNKPARLHLGMARAKDLCAATYTLTSTEEFKKAINHTYTPQKEALSAALVREPIAQSPFLNTYLGSGFESRIYILMDVHHIKDEKTGIKGIGAKVCDYKIDLPQGREQEVLDDIKLAVIYDSIAAGRNIIAGIKNLKERCPNLEKIVTVSVYATYTGCERIAKACNELGLNIEMFCMHELLDASPINEYDSFYPHWNICKEDEIVMKQFYGERYHDICMGGDWTANTLGKDQAIDIFITQLKDIGIDPKKFGLKS